MKRGKNNYALFCSSASSNCIFLLRRLSKTKMMAQRTITSAQIPRKGQRAAYLSEMKPTKHQTSVGGSRLQENNGHTNDADEDGAVGRAEFVWGKAHVIITIFHFHFRNDQCGSFDTISVGLEHKTVAGLNTVPDSLFSIFAFFSWNLIQTTKKDVW